MGLARQAGSALLPQPLARRAIRFIPPLEQRVFADCLYKAGVIIATAYCQELTKSQRPPSLVLNLRSLLDGGLFGACVALLGRDQPLEQVLHGPASPARLAATVWTVWGGGAPGEAVTLTVSIDNRNVAAFAEWIAEETADCTAPRYGCAYVPIADPSFSSAYAYGTMMSTYADIFNYRRFDLVDAHNVRLTQPPPPNSAAQGLTVTCCAN